jgi:hypothetical protein
MPERDHAVSVAGPAGMVDFSSTNSSASSTLATRAAMESLVLCYAAEVESECGAGFSDCPNE